MAEHETDNEFILEVSALIGGQILNLIQQGIKLNKTSDEILHAIIHQCDLLIIGHEDLVQEYFQESK